MALHDNLGAGVRAFVIGLAMLLVSGCERTVLAFVNQGVPRAQAQATYSTRHDLTLDIYPAVGRENATAPVVVFFHGGGWQSGSAAQYRFVGRRLAEQGWLAIVADYRKWPRAGFPAFVEDGADAVAWVHANASKWGGDPARLYVMGHSAGAQIAALIGTDQRYLAHVGMKSAQLAGVIGLSGPYDFDITGQYVPIFGPPAQWPNAMAVNFVDGDEPPFLLVHGTADKVVWPRNSEALAARLHEHGIKADVMLIPEAGHAAPMLAFYRGQSRPEVLQAVKAFIGP